VKAVIFDLDGVVAPSEQAQLFAWQSIARTFGLEIPPRLWSEGLGSYSRPNIADRIRQSPRGAESSARELGEWKRSRTAEFLFSHGPNRGLSSWLRELREMRVATAIASNASRLWVFRTLEIIGMSNDFSVVVACEDGLVPKPAPDLYFHALSLLGIAPEDAVAIEDSKAGCAAALTAGLPTIGFRHSLNRKESLLSPAIEISSFCGPSPRDLLENMRVMPDSIPALI
jgi:HAD superfamily hydrolase (TIGR01509 family)